MTVLTHLQARLKIGQPFTRNNLTVFPLLDENAPLIADYLPFGAARRDGAISITEISEGGSVPQLAVHVTGGSAVLLLDGEELIGARQNRIVNLTILVGAKTKLAIPVSCVEKGRWSYRSSEFGASPRTMYPRARARKMMDVSCALKSHGGRSADQGQIWDDVDLRASELAYRSPTSAMSDIFENQTMSIEDYLHDLVWLDGQVGAAFAIDGAIVGLDVFDSQNVAREYLPKVVRSYALDAIALRSRRPSTAMLLPTKMAEAEEEDVEALLAEICEAKSDSFPALGIGSDLRIDSKEIAGAALIRDGAIVHLSAFKKVLPASRDNVGANSARQSQRVQTRGSSVNRNNPGTPAGGEARARRGRSERYPLEILRNHMIVRVDGGRALVDTGSPVSIGRGEPLILQGHTWRPSTANAAVLDSVRDHLGIEIDWLIGHDIFAAHRMLLDWRAGIAHVGRAPTRHILNKFPMELVMGVPLISASYKGRPIRAVLDSGAALSYAPPAAVLGAAEAGAYSDFYPGAGAFETETWTLPMSLGEREVNLRVGVLPAALQMLFSLLLGPAGWIIGSDFFRERATLLDYRWGHVLDLADEAGNS